MVEDSGEDFCFIHTSAANLIVVYTLLMNELKKVDAALFNNQLFCFRSLPL